MCDMSSALPRKNPGITAVLALVFGIFGLYGIGHIYVGRLKRGFILLAVGIVLAILTYLSLIFGIFTFGLGFIIAIPLIIVDLVLWIWQTFDSYKLAKEYNRIVQETEKEPW